MSDELAQFVKAHAADAGLRKAHEDYRAKQILDAVEGWARPGAKLIREFELIAPPQGDEDWHVPGRVDGLLVPVMPWECGWRPRRGWAWDGASFAGVEVKVSVADFRRGLKEDQFARYQRALGALYLAGPERLIAEIRRDVPAGVGLLAFDLWPVSLKCLRHAKTVPVRPPPQMFWKVLHALDEAARTRERALEARDYETTKKASDAAGKAIAAALRVLGDIP